MIVLDNVKPIPIFESRADNVKSDTWACDCKFEKGKKYLVTAPSGKGKSTLLHILYGLRNDYDGACSIDGKLITDFSMDEWSELRQLKFSMVFQDLRLFLKLSAIDNILLKASLTDGKSESEIRHIAEQLGIGHLMDKPCGTLSYGQRQRVAIIRALSHSFDMLLLDEPFSHLDADNIAIATELIKKELKARNAGLILVSLGEPYDFNYDEKRIL